MSAPRDIELGGVLLVPFVRYLFLALVILIAVRFVLGRPGLRSMFCESSTCGRRPVEIVASLMAFWI